MNEVKRDELAEYLFCKGENYRAYDYLGAHEENGEIVFRVWAPSASEVFLCGDFNNWGYDKPMNKFDESGIWTLSVDKAELSGGDCFNYKYIVRGKRGDIYKSDPYARGFQCPPETSSVFIPESDYKWSDGGWLKYRKKAFSKERFYSQPINIYELHALSWKKKENGEFYNYRELADELCPYVKQMGYTHVELMPIAEHPFDASWGYQICGYFAPTARLGSPDDFRAFVDKMHSAGIGVILDWVPAHFPKDEHGLFEFDGSPLYEYQGWDRIENKGWGTRCFDVARGEVASFLISNADFWLRNFHIDGLRVDAVASMLYLDYDRRGGEWIPNVYGENKNLESIEFFKKLNGYISREFPDALMIAEESTDFPGVTASAENGLGFSMKWDMGFMNDTLSYMESDPIYRKYSHGRLTFSMIYAFGERYTMPISHDEVVHGKRSLLDKMFGSYDEKFASVRAYMGYMMTHPGKKLMFMGNEIGQFDEWKYDGEIEWFLLDYDKHARLQRYFAEINHFYLENPELWEDDCSWEGFKWIDPDNAELSVLSYRRLSAERRGRRSELYVVLNFTPVKREDYKLYVEKQGRYEEVFNSDREIFGGHGNENLGELEAKKRAYGGYELNITVPPMSVVIFKKKAQRRKS